MYPRLYLYVWMRGVFPKIRNSWGGLRHPGRNVGCQLGAEPWGSEKPAVGDTFGGTQAGGGRGSCGLHEFVKSEALSAVMHGSLPLVPTGHREACILLRALLFSWPCGVEGVTAFSIQQT